MGSESILSPCCFLQASTWRWRNVTHCLAPHCEPAFTVYVFMNSFMYPCLLKFTQHGHMLSWDTYKYMLVSYIFFYFMAYMIRCTDCWTKHSIQSEQFTIDRVTAVLEWTLSNSLSQYPQLLGNVSVDIVLNSGVEMLLLGNTCSTDPAIQHTV